MHVDIIKNRKSRPCSLVRESFRENGKVRHRTLLNISHLPPATIMALKRAFQGEFDGVAFTGKDSIKSEQGPQFGALYVMARIAEEIGLIDVLGRDREGKLALLMVIAQVIGGMSRRAVVQWARNQAVHEVFDLGDPDCLGFDHRDLYNILDYLAQTRFRIELDLFNKTGKQCNRLFLYDVTSSYLEGNCNELAAWGYNRDGKKGKKQIVIGLLTDKDGDPVAVDVFAGNTSDPKTVMDQVILLSERFGVEDVVFVGDRGMLKNIPLESIDKAGFSYITAITKPQIRSLIKQGVLQLSMFDETLGEVEHAGVRYVFRRNPVRAAEIEDCRFDRLKTAQILADRLSHDLAASSRKRLDVALRKVTDKIESLRIDGFVKVEVDGRTISVDVDHEALDRKSRLDGVYVLKTDVSSNELETEAVHRAYKSLFQVEMDFRSMKTDLQVRPVFVRKESRTRGHVLVVMLALVLRREIERRLKNTEIEVGHAVERLNGWTILRESLGPISFSRIPDPNQFQQAILSAVGVKQPTSLSVYSKRHRRKKK